jgi:cell division cycle protein 37
VPAKPEPPPIPGALDTKKPKKKTTTTTTFETLNPASVSSSAPAAPVQPKPETEEMDADDDQEGEGLTVPELTPVLEGFSHLPLWDYQASWDYIKEHRDVVVPGAQDALLVAAMRAEREGNHTYAKQCVHQSKLLSYCESLGRDGVRVFFMR